MFLNFSEIFLELNTLLLVNWSTVYCKYIKTNSYTVSQCLKQKEKNSNGMFEQEVCRFTLVTEYSLNISKPSSNCCYLFIPTICYLINSILIHSMEKLIYTFLVLAIFSVIFILLLVKFLEYLCNPAYSIPSPLQLITIHKLQKQKRLIYTIVFFIAGTVVQRRAPICFRK